MMIGAREVIHHLYGNWKPESIVPMVGARTPAVPEPTRRQEPRVEERKICAYELCESIDEEAVVIQQGEVYSLNRSAHGLLVLMGQVPRLKQLMEVHIPESKWRRFMNLYVVQWTKPIHVESQGDLFLVGCRLTFGPSHYWTF